MLDIAVIGAGGHSKVVHDIIRSKKEYILRAILDDKYDELKVEDDIFLGPISSVQRVLDTYEGIKFIIAIGSNEVRKMIVSRLGLSSDYYISLVHETAVISPSASIRHGTVIMANAVIHADASVGIHAIINTAAIVEHDNRIGDYVHLAPRATLCGDVKAEEGAFIGAGATVIPGISIGEWSVIGAGATVIQTIPSRSTAVGNPAKVIKQIETNGML
jgi:acetyltransferase EpsM